MIRRITALPFLVCGWCAAQATQNVLELERRLSLAEVERSHGRLTVAESMLADVQAEIERTEGPGLLLAQALREHGLLRNDQDRSEDAIPFYERALAMFRASPRVSPVVVGLVLANLASSHVDCGHFEVALSLSTEAMTLLRPAVQPAQPEFAVALYAHGIALHGLGRNTDALRDLREALESWRHAAQPDYAQVALVNEAIGGCLADLGYTAQAEASEREALAMRAKLFGPDSLSFAASLNNLGVLLVHEQRWSEGRQSLETTARIFEQFGESEQRRLAAALGNLGFVYCNQARNGAQTYAKAEEVYRRKLAIEERMFGSSDPRVSTTLETLGEILYRERAYNEAGQIYGRGLAIQQAAFGPTDPKTRAAAKRYNAFVKKMKANIAR